MQTASEPLWKIGRGFVVRDLPEGNVSFDYADTVNTESSQFFKRTGKIIIPLPVREILEEQFAHKLA